MTVGWQVTVNYQQTKSQRSKHEPLCSFLNEFVQIMSFSEGKSAGNYFSFFLFRLINTDNITGMTNSPLYTCQSCLPIKFQSAVFVPFYTICLLRSALDSAWLKNDSLGLKTDRDGKICERIHQICVLSLWRLVGWLGWLGGHVGVRITPLWMCIYQPNCHVMTQGVIKEHQSISSWHGATRPPPPLLPA